MDPNRKRQAYYAQPSGPNQRQRPQHPHGARTANPLPPPPALQSIRKTFANSPPSNHIHAQHMRPAQRSPHLLRQQQQKQPVSSHQPHHPQSRKPYTAAPTNAPKYAFPSFQNSPKNVSGQQNPKRRIGIPTQNQGPHRSSTSSRQNYASPSKVLANHSSAASHHPARRFASPSKVHPQFTKSNMAFPSHRSQTFSSKKVSHTHPNARQSPLARNSPSKQKVLRKNSKRSPLSVKSAQPLSVKSARKQVIARPKQAVRTTKAKRFLPKQAIQKPHFQQTHAKPSARTRQKLAPPSRAQPLQKQFNPAPQQNLATQPIQKISLSPQVKPNSNTRRQPVSRQKNLKQTIAPASPKASDPIPTTFNHLSANYTPKPVSDPRQMTLTQMLPRRGSSAKKKSTVKKKKPTPKKITKQTNPTQLKMRLKRKKKLPKTKEQLALEKMKQEKRAAVLIKKKSTTAVRIKAPIDSDTDSEDFTPIVRKTNFKKRLIDSDSDSDDLPTTLKATAIKKIVKPSPAPEKNNYVAAPKKYNDHEIPAEDHFDEESLPSDVEENLIIKKASSKKTRRNDYNRRAPVEDEDFVVDDDVPLATENRMEWSGVYKCCMRGEDGSAGHKSFQCEKCKEWWHELCLQHKHFWFDTELARLEESGSEFHCPICKPMKITNNRGFAPGVWILSPKFRYPLQLSRVVDLAQFKLKTRLNLVGKKKKVVLKNSQISPEEVNQNDGSETMEISNSVKSQDSNNAMEIEKRPIEKMEIETQNISLETKESNASEEDLSKIEDVVKKKEEEASSDTTIDGQKKEAEEEKTLEKKKEKEENTEQIEHWIAWNDRGSIVVRTDRPCEILDSPESIVSAIERRFQSLHHSEQFFKVCQLLKLLHAYNKFYGIDCLKSLVKPLCKKEHQLEKLERMLSSWCKTETNVKFDEQASRGKKRSIESPEDSNKTPVKKRRRMLSSESEGDFVLDSPISKNEKKKSLTIKIKKKKPQSPVLKNRKPRKRQSFKKLLALTAEEDQFGEINFNHQENISSANLTSASASASISSCIPPPSTIVNSANKKGYGRKVDVISMGTKHLKCHMLKTVKEKYGQSKSYSTCFQHPE